MKARIHAENISGSIRAPGSKSYSQRFILMGCVADHPVNVHGVGFSEDEQMALGIIRSAGATLTYNGDNVSIQPNFSCPKFVDVGESATSYRLSLGLLSAMRCSTEFVGHKSLSRRPMENLITALESVGTRIKVKDDGFVTIDATDVGDGDIEVDQSQSSQYVSSLLLFLAFSGKNGRKLRITGKKSSEGYVRITLSCLRTMGYVISEQEDTYTMEKSEGMEVRDLYVEKDYSSAAFFLILGALASDDGVSIEGLPDNSLQSDATILDRLKDSSEGITVTFAENNIIATSMRSYVKHIEIDADDTPDLAPPLSVLGIFSSEGVTIRNPARLGTKESDRYSEIIRLAESFGARVETGDDYLDIRRGQDILNPEKLSFDDHRMIMSAVIAGTVSGYEIEYSNLEKINKSYPSFLTDLKKMGATINMEPVL